jgi:hypothetical protein
MEKICPDCKQHKLQEGMWFDYAKQAEGETGNVIQPVLYCCGCMYQEEVD